MPAAAGSPPRPAIPAASHAHHAEPLVTPPPCASASAPFHAPQHVKYGVVSADALLHDLHTWSQLYASGRLHKPVSHMVAPPAGGQLPAALQANLRHALRTALLLSPQHSTFKVRLPPSPLRTGVPLASAACAPREEAHPGAAGAQAQAHASSVPTCTPPPLPLPQHNAQDLFKRITALSYTGDVRMGLAEDNRKVERIVDGSYSQFVDLYGPQLQQVGSRAAAPPPPKPTNPPSLHFQCPCPCPRSP